MLIHSKTIDNLLTKKRFAYKFWYLFSLVWKCLKRIRSPLCLKRMKKSNFVDIHFFFSIRLQYVNSHMGVRKSKNIARLADVVHTGSPISVFVK